MGASDNGLYAARRKSLLEQMEPGSVAVFPTAAEARRANDTEFPYRPDTDFYYLTGFREPDAVAVLARDHKDLAAYTLFVRERDPERETWTGRRAGPEGATATFGADEAFTIGELDKKLPQILANASALYWCLGRYPKWDQRMASFIDGLRWRQKQKEYPPRKQLDPTLLLQAMRLRKTAADIALIRRAVAISAEAHREAMALARPGLFEYELQAVIEYVFRKNGTVPGYGTIVGAGANATVLHYVTNDHKIADGDLILIDAGAEVPALFTGDITRTYPANGKWTKVQQQAYELVLTAQKAAVDTVKPGATLKEGIHGVAVKILTEGMLKLGLLEGDLDELIEKETFKKFYMHGTSHWLGMDVHDAGDYYIDGTERPLEPDMVITVEPGLYIPPDAEGVPDEWRGIGIRIEDDVLVTADGHDVLSAEAPKEIADLDREMKRKSAFA